MRMSWTPLREHITAHVDALIAGEPCREARATLTFHRARIVDAMAAAVLERILGERGKPRRKPRVAHRRMLQLN
jgi:hypothetical protein